MGPPADVPRAGGLAGDNGRSHKDPLRDRDESRIRRCEGSKTRRTSGGRPGRIPPVTARADTAVLALDQGTTGYALRSLFGARRRRARRAATPEFTQHYPRPGLGRARRPTRSGEVTSGDRARRLLARARATRADSRRSASPISARPPWSGIARPAGRCTARSSGRTAAPPSSASAASARATDRRIRARTGLVLDPYFSGTKLAWMLDARRRRCGARRGAGELAFGTVDTWLIWQLDRRPRPRDRPHQRLAHAALRHPAPSLGRRRCSIVSTCPRRCCPRSGPRAATSANRTASAVAGRDPVAGIAGDQQAALFGQGCVEPGHGEEHVRHRLLPAPPHRDRARRVARGPAHDDRLRRARRSRPTRSRARLHRRRGDPVAARRARAHPDRRGDASARASRPRQRAASTWCRRSSGSARPTGTPTRAARSSGSRAARPGPTSCARRSSRSPSRRATCVDAMTSRRRASARRAARRRRRGGQRLPDAVPGRPARRAASSARASIETTALGAAFLAGLGVGFWKDAETLRRTRVRDRLFTPAMGAEEREKLYAGWRAAVARVRTSDH